MRHPLVSTLCLCILAATAFAQTSPFKNPPAPSGPQKILPGALWPDDAGNHVQAHGGGIVKIDDTYYWFGEYRPQDLPRNERAVGCYASKDLARWVFRGKVFTMLAEERPSDLPGTGLVLERPKVYHNAKTGKFVMYMHLDSGNYGAAEVGVAVSDTVDGQYKFLKHFRPLGKESRDIGQFIDDDGSAYLIFEERPTRGFHIAKLSDDYLTGEKSICFMSNSLEGGAVVKFDGLYYCVGSHLTGWAANPNLYASAKSLAGPWSEFKNIAPPEVNTYGSQSTMLLRVTGTKATTVLFMGDIWRPNDHWNGRYLWMPLEIGNGTLHLPEPREFTLNITTGEAVINKSAPAMTLPAPATRPAGVGRRGRGGATQPGRAGTQPARGQ
jgi:hypothetical protein